MLRLLCILVTLALLVPTTIAPTVSAQVTSTRTETVDISYTVGASPAVAGTAP